VSVLFSKALSGQCRWIVCEAVSKPSLRGDTFGGRRVCGAATSWPTSFCIDHRLAAYQRTDKVAGPPQEFAVLRRQPDPETLPELTEIFG